MIEGEGESASESESERGGERGRGGEGRRRGTIGETKGSSNLLLVQNCPLRTNLCHV